LKHLEGEVFSLHTQSHKWIIKTSG